MSDFKEPEYEWKDFKVGDILYAKVQHAGCSYYYQFVKVIRKTKTGRYRVICITSQSNGEKSGDQYHEYTPVVPDDTETVGESFLIMPNGYKKHTGTWTGLWFEKFNHTLDLKNYWDAGD